MSLTSSSSHTDKPTMSNSSLEDLSNELFDNILTHITSQCTLNSLSQTSRSLYHRTTPKLYQSWSYHGLQEELKPLRQFLETINWRPDLAAHVKELDIREWGDCPRLEDYVGDPGDGYEERMKKEEDKKKELQKGTLMDDELLGEEGDEEDETYEESENEEDSDDEMSDEDFDEDIAIEELELLGPVQPFSHDDCIEGQCKAGKKQDFRKVEQDFGREGILVDYFDILYEENEDKLVILLLSKLPNLRTMWMVMPEVSFEWSYPDNAFCQFLENTSDLATSGGLQKLETLYICSPMHPGGKDHREYELDLRRLFPFMRLPNLRSLYTLTAYVYYPNWPKSPIDYTPLKHTSNITTLSYDEASLNPYDVIQSLGIVKALKSFRWTAADFVSFEKSLGKSLAAHKDTLEDLYFDNRHNDDYEEARKKAPKDGILIGSLKEYSKLTSLAIDVSSLCGHQKWAPSPISLIDSLPPNLEYLTLFVKVLQVERAEGVQGIQFNNHLWYSSFTNMIRDAASALPKLQNISIQLTRDIPSWAQREYGDIAVDLSAFQEAVAACAESRIGFDVGIAVEGCTDDQREVGNTTIPYFLEQIRMRNPGRDW